jgi:hypothetical protein
MPHSSMTTRVALVVVCCVAPQTCAFLFPSSSLHSVHSRLSTSLMSKPSQAISSLSLRNPARASLHQRTVCRLEPGGAGPQRFPAPGSDDTWLALPRVFVLLFNPRTDNEGICELRCEPCKRFVFGFCIRTSGLARRSCARSCLLQAARFVGPVRDQKLLLRPQTRAETTNFVVYRYSSDHTQERQHAEHRSSL